MPLRCPEASADSQPHLLDAAFQLVRAVPPPAHSVQGGACQPQVAPEHGPGLVARRDGRFMQRHNARAEQGCAVVLPAA
jgi:hypothetical protein